MSTKSSSAQQQATFQQNTYDQLKKELTDTIKKIENYKSRRKLPQDATERADRITQYTREVVGTYNCFVLYIKTFYDTFTLDSQFKTNEIVEHLKTKVKNSLEILNLTAILPQKLDTIDSQSIQILNQNINNTDSDPILQLSSHSHASDSENSEVDEQNSTPSNTFDPPGGHSSTANQNKNDFPPSKSDLSATNNLENSDQIEIEQTMALTPGDILNGIPDFDSKSQIDVNKFIANVDMMYTLAPAQAATILTIAKTKLVTANKLGNLDGKTWAEIKTDINQKYKLTMPFEVAQEKLISIKQGPKETLDAYANRVKSLLDSLNSASTNANNDIQASNRVMNENLAIRKFKQNIFEKETRVMAISSEHTSLVEAISHAMSKCEQLNASNVVHQPQFEKKEPNPSNVNKNGNNSSNGSNGKQFNQKNSKPNPKSGLLCRYCKRTNHTIENCRDLARKNGNSGNKSNSEKQENQAQNSNAAVAVRTEKQNDEEPLVNQAAHVDIQSLTLQPYHHLNY